MVDRDDTLLENYWLAWSVQRKTPLEAVKTPAKGKRALNQKLLEISAIDPARLPYIQDVVEMVAQWRQRGRRVALVIGATQQQAGAVARHLGILELIYGPSDGFNYAPECLCANTARRTANVQNTFVIRIRS